MCSPAHLKLCLACRVQHEYLAAYITELALPEYSALQWLPSIIAAAAVLLARHICAINIPIMRSLQPWSPTLQHYSGYRCTVTCSQSLHKYAQAASLLRHPPALPLLHVQFPQHISGVSSEASLCWDVAPNLASGSGAAYPSDGPALTALVASPGR